jgi:hypothetical protein
MKKSLLLLCLSIFTIIHSRSAQAEDNIATASCTLDSNLVLCKQTYWTWTCQKCGTTNVQEANKCSGCKTPR